ncbi:MAG: cytochrome c oxidase subunit I [Gemmatimonadetes bacterium]|nr:cytochrome c oxidase subunit I [Gemmatimonadota bacterium]
MTTSPAPQAPRFPAPGHAAPAHAPAEVHAHHGPQSFWTRYVFSTDHKTIAKQYLFTAAFMSIFAVGWSMLIRLQLAYPHNTWPILSSLFPGLYQDGVLLPERYLSLTTMHGTVMVFFVISLALVSGFGNFIIPLQVGAHDMAYPFLNALSYWTIVPACLLMMVSFFVPDGAASAGWTAYPPLSALAEAGSGLGQTIWLLAMAPFIASFTMGGLNFVATILNMRTRGMSLMRMPLTIWTLFYASVLGILTFPALTAAAIMLLLDRLGGTSFFLPAGLIVSGQVLPHQGGTPLLFQHLFWFLGHPEVYVLALPAIGIAFDVLAAFGRRPSFGYRNTVWSILAVSALGMIAWGHHMFTSGMNPYLGEYFSIVTVLITLPFSVIAINLVASLWRAEIRLHTPMLFALGLIAAIGVGGLGGLWLGTATSDMYLQDSYFVVGHFHFMIGVVTGFGIFAGTYYWFPKMFGRMMNETLGRVHFWLTTLGTFAAFMGMHFLGMGGYLRRIYDPTTYRYAQHQPLNVFISYALLLAALGQVLFAVNLFWSLFRGKRAGANPWDATTLEWTTESPAGHNNWETLPTVSRGPYEYRTDNAPAGFHPQGEVEAAG